MARPMAVVVAAALLLAACQQSVLELEIGQCLNLPEGTAASAEATPPSMGTTISTVATVPCEEPHDAEVYALPNHPGAETALYPGGAALQEFVATECEAAFEGYVGIDYASSEIFSTGLTPTAESWADGDRQVVCLLVGNEGAQLTGSKRGSQE